jgi:hypothetical protein
MEDLNEYLQSNHENINTILKCILAEKPRNYSTQKIATNYNQILRQHNIAYEYIAVQTEGDGNCFYYAASLGLFGSPKYYTLIKTGLVQTIKENQGLIENVLKTTCSTRTFDDIVYASFLEFAWATEFHCFGLSFLLKRPVIVLDEFEQRHKYCAYAASENKTPLCFLLANNHFSALMPSPFSEPIQSNVEQFKDFKIQD